MQHNYEYNVNLRDSGTVLSMQSISSCGRSVLGFCRYPRFSSNYTCCNQKMKLYRYIVYCIIARLFIHESSNLDLGCGRKRKGGGQEKIRIRDDVRSVRSTSRQEACCKRCSETQFSRAIDQIVW